MATGTSRTYESRYSTSSWLRVVKCSTTLGNESITQQISWWTAMGWNDFTAAGYRTRVWEVRGSDGKWLAVGRPDRQPTQRHASFSFVNSPAQDVDPCRGNEEPGRYERPAPRSLPDRTVKFNNQYTSELFNDDLTIIPSWPRRP
jgi:hypothetical protein